MAEYLTSDLELKGVADHIRTKGDTTEQLEWPVGFESAIDAIQEAKPEQEKEITISENGDYPITPDVGKVLSKVLAHVNVSGGGGGSVQMGPFVYMYGGTFTPASDMAIFNPPGYVYDSTYKKRTTLVIGTKRPAQEVNHLDLGAALGSKKL